MGLDRRVNGIVGHVHEKRLAGFHCRGLQHRQHGGQHKQAHQENTEQPRLGRRDFSIDASIVVSHLFKDQCPQQQSRSVKMSISTLSLFDSQLSDNIHHINLNL